MLAVIIARPRKPVVSLAWLAFIMLVPWLGELLYLLIGARRVGYRRRRRYARDLTLHHASRNPGVHRTFITKPKIDEHQRAVVDVADALVGMPILGGNQVELLPHANKFIDCLIEDIEKARNHVQMLSFILEDAGVGPVAGEPLVKAAKRGVDCRVMGDAAGSFFFFLGLAQRLREQGVKVVEDLPVTSLRRLFARLDLRNHRKLAVIDGLVAYTGSH